MTNYLKQAKDSIGNGARVTLKLLVILGIMIVLLIPQGMISDLIRERQYRQNGIESNIAAQVGGPINIQGPVLVVPYEEENKTITIDQNKQEKVTIELVKSNAYFNANELNINSDAQVENKKKSIYKIPYIHSINSIKGNFSSPDFSKWKTIDPDKILWNDAFIVLGINDLKGISDNPTLNWGGQTINFEPGANGSNVYHSSVHAQLPENWRDQLAFDIELNVRGTTKLTFACTAKSNSMEMKSNWPDPNFETIPAMDDYPMDAVEYSAANVSGALPTSSEIFKDKSGFEANWNESQFSIDQVPQWLDSGNQGSQEVRTMGVEFVNLSDNYSKVSRSIKYMAMIIALVFTAFFIIELLKANRVHPFQYTLIGSAIAVFFLLLLAFSEYIGFNWAYLIASVATTSLVGLYSVSVFKNKQLAASVSIILTVLFAFIFVILNATEYSLILGATGLFAILAIVMYVTRNITWYSKAEG